jgi:sugar (pentulose or hexulose) kinase
MADFLAFDIGTSEGRASIATLTADRFDLKMLHRFANKSVFVNKTLYWDILYLWDGILTGLQTCLGIDDLHLESIGLDTWAVDFALLDEAGNLLDNPVHNRDARTDGIMQQVFKIVARDELYQRTGIQFMQINSLYQLYALVLANAPSLRYASTFLSIADLLNYWLTGNPVVEFTSATCTQCYDPNAGAWATDILDRLQIPSAMFPTVVQPGTVLGTFQPPAKLFSHVEHLPVVAVATHDTGSAVAAVPAEMEHFAYISSGTWSLMGAEVPSPVISPASLQYNFTNEGGVNGTFRLLKNILGMWLVQACQEAWALEGAAYSPAQLVEMAAAVPAFGPLIDPHPNNPHFRTPGDMPARIKRFWQETGQSAPDDKGCVLRCIFESLALKYRQTLHQLEEVLGHQIDVIHIVGGGARNELLNQMTADATNRLVIAGPAEATTMGNVIVQATAAGHLDSLAAGRDLVRRSTPLKSYEPCPSDHWDRAYSLFLHITEFSDTN